MVKKRKKSKTCDNIANPVPQYSQNVEQEKIQNLVSDAIFLVDVSSSRVSRSFPFRKAEVLLHWASHLLCQIPCLPQSGLLVPADQEYHSHL